MAAVVAALLLLLSPLAMQSVVARSKPLPVVARVSQDSSTGLYLISVRNVASSNPLVLDLAGPLLWWSCHWGQEQEHPIPCGSGTCRVANRNHPPNCPYVDGGKPGSSEPSCNCTAYPYNPVNGKCGSGGLTWEWLSANTTDGRRPLYPVSFRAVASCAPDDLPSSSFPEIIRWQGMRYGVPVGTWSTYPGVAGLSRSPLSLPSQVAAGLKVSSKFALCLPNVAIFGGGPVHIPGSDESVETVTDHLSRTRLVRNPRNSAYYIDVAGIAVNGARVALPDGALALDASSGQGGVALSTVTPYTALRPDIYRAVLAAFDAVTAGLPRAVDVPKPLERCFNVTVMNQNLMGTWTTGPLPVAVSIDLMLTDGKNWTFTSYSVTDEVVPQTVCFAFVEMAAGSAAAYAVPDSPAVVIGGHQMENNLLEFDLKKGVLGYTGVMPDKRMGACSNFNFENGLGR